MFSQYSSEVPIISVTLKAKNWWKKKWLSTLTPSSYFLYSGAYYTSQRMTILLWLARSDSLQCQRQDNCWRTARWLKRMKTRSRQDTGQSGSSVLYISHVKIWYAKFWTFSVFSVCYSMSQGPHMLPNDGNILNIPFYKVL